MEEHIESALFKSGVYTALRDLHTDTDWDIVHCEATWLLVRKDYDPVVPAIIMVLRNDTFGDKTMCQPT